MTIPFRGYSRNFLSQFKPHYLTMETYAGPFQMNPVTKLYYVIGLGENPRNYLDLIGFGLSGTSVNTPLLNTKDDYYTSASTVEGRMRLYEVQEQVSGSGQLCEANLSAAEPNVVVEFISEPNLYATDLRLFAPQNAVVSIIVADACGMRLGYSTSDGITYSEIIGYVTNMEQRPISLRLLEPAANETYTVTIALLSPGPQDVPVTLFYEPVKDSGAIMTAYPSQVIIDGYRGATNNALLRIAEASGQQALTDVNAVLSKIEAWSGSSEGLQILNDPNQVIGNVPAGEQGYVSWDVNYPTGTTFGKYVGTIAFSSNETADLTVPVVALVRYASEMVGAFEGPDPNVTVMQKNLTLGPDGTAQTWVHIPAGYWAVHGAMGVVGASADLQNPSIDIGADGSVEWAFSGKFDIGVLVNNIEDAFNDYILSQGSGGSDVNVPIIIRANAGETIQLNGIQLYLDSKVGDFEPDGDVDWFDLAKFVSHWLEQDCNDPNWCEGADINHSNTVNFVDFAFFAQHWLEGV